MTRLHLVRHGPSAVDPSLPPHEWPLDPAGHAAVDALRDSGRLPRDATWCSSPEPKALETARRLTDLPVDVVPELREHERAVTPWFDDQDEWLATVRRAFDQPETSALPQWEPLAAARDRLLPAVRRLLTACATDDLVLVGHGTAWTLVRAHLRDEPPDLGWWVSLRMPDHDVLTV